MSVSRKSKLPTTAESTQVGQRRRVVEAMVSSVARKGYGETSVADVIGAAGVSRKTFYELFDDKEDCFLNSYDELSERFARALAAVKPADTAASRRAHAAEQIRVYLTVLALDVATARAFIVEIQAAGPRSVPRRAKMLRLFADLVFGWAVKRPELRLAMIGGINEVVADALREGRDLMKLHESLVDFTQRVIDSPATQKR